MPVWSWNDGWILMALFLAHDETGAELHEIIATSDATNHAIPNPGELSEAFTKFAGCGLLTVVGDRYVIAPEYRPAIEKASRGKGGGFESGNKGLNWLKRSGLSEVKSRSLVVDDGAFALAYERYVKAIHKPKQGIKSKFKSKRGLGVNHRETTA